MAGIDKIYWHFISQGLAFIVGLTLALLVVMYVWSLDSMLVPVIVSSVFALVVEGADAMIWRRIAKRSPDSLPTFFMAVSGVRMFLAIAVMFVYYLVVGRQSMLVFFLIFMVYYLLLLIHHSAFFAKDRIGSVMDR